MSDKSNLQELRFAFVAFAISIIIGFLSSAYLSVPLRKAIAADRVNVLRAELQSRRTNNPEIVGELDRAEERLRNVLPQTTWAKIWQLPALLIGVVGICCGCGLLVGAISDVTDRTPIKVIVVIAYVGANVYVVFQFAYLAIG
jgi:hypothetical protein